MLAPVILSRVAARSCAPSGRPFGSPSHEPDTIGLCIGRARHLDGLEYHPPPGCHLKTTEDLFDSRASPRTESMVSAAVQWAERIMRKIDNVFETSEKRSL
jgi:hypothetical protein